DQLIRSLLARCGIREVKIQFGLLGHSTIRHRLPSLCVHPQLVGQHGVEIHPPEATSWSVAGVRCLDSTAPNYRSALVPWRSRVAFPRAILKVSPLIRAAGHRSPPPVGTWP